MTFHGNHTKVVTVCRPRKWLFSLAKLCEFFRESPQFKSLQYQKFKKCLKLVARDKTLFFTRYTVTKITIAVSKTLLCLEKVF